MHISIASYQFKPDKYDEMMDFARSILPELRQIKGFRQIVFVRTGETTSATHALYDSKADAEAATPKIQALFGRMKEFVTAPPSRATYDVPLFDSL